MRAYLGILCLLFSVVGCSSNNISLLSQEIFLFKSEDKQCPLWEISNTTGGCECGNNLDGLVFCQNSPPGLELYVCHCMTFSVQYNQTVVGSCQYTCQISGTGYFFPITANSTENINNFTCGPYNRTGQQCGSCQRGYAPPIYSYSLHCLNCTSSNWAKYAAVSLLPLTAFYIVAITFRFSATSPKLNCFIMCVQLIMSPPNMRILANIASVAQTPLTIFLTSYFGIWNLDFCRFCYTSFCLQPHTNTIQILSLEYFIAVYPLLLIGFTYLLVVAYDRNVPFIVCIWKPIRTILIKIRREWNIRSSLLEAFATFLLLSYVKILSVSVDLLVPISLSSKHGHTLDQYYLFNQGNMAYFGKTHLLYASLAIFFLLTFTLLPILLQFLYPCSCFQRCLNATRWNWHLLHAFMDILQGHYRDRTDGTVDRRFFSGLYLLLRVVVYASIVVTNFTLSFAYTTTIIAVAAIGVALARPYKKQVYNIVDSCLLLITALLYMNYVSLTFSQPGALVYNVNSLTDILLKLVSSFCTQL